MQVKAFHFVCLFVFQITNSEAWQGGSCGNVRLVRRKNINKRNCPQLVSRAEIYRVKTDFHKRWCRVVRRCLGQSEEWKQSCINNLDPRNSDTSNTVATIFNVSSCSIKWFNFYVFTVIGGEPFTQTEEKSYLERTMEDYQTALDGLDVTKKDSLQEAITLLDSILDLYETKSRHDEKENKTEEEKIDDVFAVTEAFEEFVIRFASHNLNDINSTMRISSDKLVLQVQRVSSLNESSFSFSEDKDPANFINFQSEDFSEKGSLVIAAVYTDLRNLLIRKQPTEHVKGTMHLNTMIMTATILPKKTLTNNVTLGFRNLKPSQSPRKCVFWDTSEEKSDWSGDGCTVKMSNRFQTVCSCNHLTHFAVLLQLEDETENDSEVDSKALEILTYVGITLSLTGIILTIACYLKFTDLRTPLSQTRISLVASLGAGQIIFLAGINATENKAACIAVAALMQYFFMVAFFWMLFEGIYLYLLVIKVYNVSAKMLIYHALSWGLPAVFVLISLSIAAGNDGVESFVGQKHCWISSETQLNWIFITFVIMIEVLNVVMLVRIIREMIKMHQVKDRQSEKLRLGIRACILLTPLLGFTWLFGLLSSVHISFAYIFTIFNSTQGFFVFLLHCVRNTEIRARFKRKIQASFPPADERTTTSKKPSEADRSDLPTLPRVS